MFVAEAPPLPSMNAPLDIVPAAPVTCDLAAGSGVADVCRARARASSSGVSAAAPKEAVPPHLPREERVLEPDSTCPKCNNAMELLGEDVSEQLARVTAMFKVIRRIRRKRICTGCGHIVQPPMPGLPIERSIAHPSLLADIVVAYAAFRTMPHSRQRWETYDFVPSFARHSSGL
ncbi:zinc-finger binding domain of transposase IS66 [Paraburkholderia aspalathi]|uniref:Zinc-finger binding domain of transposase IS66 n=1 Tax=Paraburkholderia aspalathi TaxID=1324617 RepID=A0A1I6YJF1_9BURK|nr:zinc-finger binding domain of transposase IS66 [Paraburkholderia aspalathi]